MKRTRRFQTGQLWRRRGKRISGKPRVDTWYLRYRDADMRRKFVRLGTALELPTESAARAKATEFLASINGGRRTVGPVTVAELLARYRRDELPARASTRASYRSNLARIEARWSAAVLTEVKPADVEAWLATLARPAAEEGSASRPLAPKTKANIRQLFHVLFECARRWEMHAGENPITLVRQSARRTKKLAKLNIAQYQAIEAALLEPHKTMVMIAAYLGLRVGEILGLQWGDVDFDGASLHVQRDIYQGQVDDLKSSNSDRELPLPAVIVESLKLWRANAVYQHASEYIFSQDNGRPMWADTLRESILQPVAERVGAGKIGWHAFRHLFASLVHVTGSETAVAKELMGHANFATTEGYITAQADRKRAAIDDVAALLRRVQ